MNWNTLDLSLSGIAEHYRRGDFTPGQLCRHLLAKCQGYQHKNIWIHLLNEAELSSYLHALEGKGCDDLPLYGVPFAIKDNIDLAGIPTTAGCPDFAYTPDAHAFVVARLIAAGAIPLGKTNLDQFATGLVGTRSPYGVCRNAFNDEYISGGSSSGSAVAVALELVSFSLGTDTAGSGRVPAAFNNLVGLKPTRGALSTRGVLPACRSLDCVSIFTRRSDEALRLFDLCQAFDAEDDYARHFCDSQWPGLANSTGMRVAIPPKEQLNFFGNGDAAALFYCAVARLERLGFELVVKDFGPFFEAAQLLYNGPWLAERYVAVANFRRSHPHALHPVVDDVIAPARQMRAVQAFESEYKMQSYRRRAESLFQDCHFALTPTAGTIYRIADVLAEPVALNSKLGYYTNFMNLLDLAAVAVPAGLLPSGMPWGVTLFGPAGSDRALINMAARFSAEPTLPARSHDWITLAVCGAHLSGQPLNPQLLERHGVLVEKTQTAPHYRLFALAGGPPQRPGLSRVGEGGVAIAVELWALPAAALGSFVAAIPPPLAIGKLELADGRWVSGFICEGHGLQGAEDISDFGGWLEYLDSLQAEADTPLRSAQP